MLELATAAECINIGVTLDPHVRVYSFWCWPLPAESIHAGIDDQEDALHAEDHDALEGLTDSSEAGDSDSGIAETDRQEAEAAEASSHQATDGQEQPDGGDAAAAAMGSSANMPSAKPRRRCDPGVQPVWLYPQVMHMHAETMVLTAGLRLRMQVVTLPGSQAMQTLHILLSLCAACISVIQSPLELHTSYAVC